MSAPIPEDQDQPPTEADNPPGEHPSELADEHDDVDRSRQRENAETSLDEPSDNSGGE